LGPERQWAGANGAKHPVPSGDSAFDLRRIEHIPTNHLQVRILDVIDLRRVAGKCRNVMALIESLPEQLSAGPACSAENEQFHLLPS